MSSKEGTYQTARYRLALSATLERHRDENGTLALRQYFGNDCINFSLKDAIDGGFLTPYYYYPCLVYLDPEELEDYNELTRKIIRCGGIAETGETSDYVEKLLIRRARIIAGCKSKIDKLIEVIEPYKEDYHMLVYCGATSYDRTDMDDDDQVRQIDEVNRRLYTQLGMKVCKFTSSEDPERRIEIKKMFVDESLQVITAIKCLDEGVNIPAINRAFILASSSNPKEYIQRRGRVLRKAEGKEYAEIYDFVTLPRKLEDVKYLDEEERKRDLNLVYREFERMMDFANTSSNPTKSDFLIAKIQETYRINKRAFKEESE
ncbi:Predicted HKD family nuclease [Coprococcus eutactus]|nr:Predicted HKD family nuclease [Coprococcus eutactus]